MPIFYLQLEAEFKQHQDRIIMKIILIGIIYA